MKADVSGRALRDEGMARVLRPNAVWLWKGLALIVKFQIGWTGTGEDVRTILEPKIGSPTHHNAWGALINNAQREELLSPTGNFFQMKLKRSHARITREYVR